jgi:hypothetical protein
MNENDANALTREAKHKRRLGKLQAVGDQLQVRRDVTPGRSRT